MDIYKRKSHWKWYLAAAGVLIIIISLLYTKYIADRLAERERQQAQQYVEAQRLLGKSETDTLQFFHCDMTFPLKIVQDNTTVPILLVNKAGQIEDWRNVGEDSLGKIDSAKLRIVYRRMIEAGADTIRVSQSTDLEKYVLYTHSRLLDLLRWYPFIQLFLIAVFIAFGYLGFSASRRAEENQVWLGMAKETAHQLGTPITAILGWVETLKALNENSPENQEMLDELRNDVTRLELVADRFSKIGAKPELASTNLYEQLEKCRLYMQRRAPRKVQFDFPNPADHAPIWVGLNVPLFDWVIENLLRNAIDAMENGVGKITAYVYTERRYACIDVSDTGKGIPASKFKTVFKPGYSTKIRGWGLGLSLSKRIVVQYHGGKILVKKSEPGVNTTFTVKLPMVEQ